MNLLILINNLFIAGLVMNSASSESRLNSYLMNSCASPRLSLSLTGESESNNHLRVYGPSMTGAAGLSNTITSPTGLSPLTMAHYMPYLNGLSQMDLLQQYASLANFRSVLHHSSIGPIGTHSPLITSFSVPPTLNSENSFSENTVKPLEET